MSPELQARAADVLNLDDLIEATLSAFPELSSDAQRLSLALYRELTKGKPVSADALVAATSLPPSTIDGILADWPGIYRNEAEEILGYWGLAIREMPHRLIVDGRTLFTWCAWDTLFIPELLGRPAEVQTQDPISSEPIRLHVTPDTARPRDHADLVMSYLRPDPSMASQIISSFCHHIHFFTSEKTGKQFTAKTPNTLLVSLADALTLARRKNAAQYRDVL